MVLLSSLKESQKAQKNRIQSKNAIFYAVLFLLKKKTRKPGMRFLHVIWSHFFAPQVMTKYKLRKRPIVWVDHPLDKKIPFQPHYVAIYLGFTHLWVKSIAFLYREFGRPALPHIVTFVRLLTSLYYESAKVYLQVQSTTNRPRYLGNFYFKVIHLLDPHLHCIPSLHVAIVGLTYSYIRSAIETLAPVPADYRTEIDYLWRKAVLITNSILFIKQHSVNCVSAGLFTLSSNKFGFSHQTAYQVIDDLFTGAGNTLPDSDELRTYIRELYEYFNRENKTKPSAQVLVDFLKGYDSLSQTGVNK